MSFGRKPGWDKKVILDISSICPHKCIYCAHQSLGLSTPELMDNDLFYEIATILKKDGVKSVYPYMSGEPFCHPSVHDFLTHLSRIGMAVNVATKAGVPIEGAAFENMVSNFNQQGQQLTVEITMPSLKDEDMVEEFVTCNPKVIRSNIEMMMKVAEKYKGLNLVFITIVTDASRKHLAETGDFFKSRGFRWVTKTAGYWLDTKPKGVSILRSPTGPCRLTTHPAISPKGNVTICCHDFLYQTNLGNVVERGSLLEIVNSPEYQETLRLGNLRKLPMCKGCV